MIVRLSIYIGYYLLNLFLIKDMMAAWLTLPFMALVIYNVWHIRDKYVGVEDMLTFVLYLFFVIEPLQQLDHGHVGTEGPVSAITYHPHFIVAGALMALLFYAIFTVGMRMLASRRGAPTLLRIPRNRAELMLIVAILGCISFILLYGGLTNTLANRSDKALDDINILAIVGLGMQMIATLLLATFVRPRPDRYLLYFIAALGALLITSNPFNTARFVLIATYVPLIFILLRGRLVSWLFYVGTLAAIIIVMPVLSLTTRFGTSISLQDARGGSSLFSLPFIDVYDMLVECARYTDANGHSWGWKLVGDALFLLPRSIWTGKPTLNALDIGNELAQDKIAGTSNLSMFVIGDGYRDLGYIGVAIASVLLVLMFHWLVYRRVKIINGSPVFHYLLIASLPIVVRGPFSAVLPLLFMETLSLAILTWLFAVPARDLESPADDERTAEASAGSVRLA